jgi:hypothetical protein
MEAAHNDDGAQRRRRSTMNGSGAGVKRRTTAKIQGSIVPVECSEQDHPLLLPPLGVLVCVCVLTGLFVFWGQLTACLPLNEQQNLTTHGHERRPRTHVVSWPVPRRTGNCRMHLLRVCRQQYVSCLFWGVVRFCGISGRTPAGLLACGCITHVLSALLCGRAAGFGGCRALPLEQAGDTESGRPPVEIGYSSSRRSSSAYLLCFPCSVGIRKRAVSLLVLELP